MRAMLTALSIAVLLAVPAIAQDIPDGPPPAERLLVRFDDGDFSLFSRMVVRKVIPPSDSLPDVNGGLLGFWYELQDGEGGVLYRRIIGDPIRLVFEGPDLGAQGPSLPERQEAIPDSRTFPLLIPLAPPGAELVLFGSPLEPGAQGQPVGELARISLAPIIE